MYRNLLGILAVFAVALLVVGLTFSAAAEDRASFVFVNGSEPKTLDPQKMTGQLEGRIADCLFEGLTRKDAETLEPVPAVAERWDTSPDGKRWTFHLRADAKWTNGDPVTARDFVYAWKRLQEPEIGAEYAYLMHVVRHAEAYNKFGAQTKDLRGDPEGGRPELKEGIVARLRALLARHPDGVPATDWQAFAALPMGGTKNDAHAIPDAVTNTKSAAIIDALAKTTGTLTPEEGAALVRALDDEATRRAEAWKRAQDHFGVDEGVFAPDDRTFVVELNAFTAYFLDLTAFYVNHPVHRGAVEANPEDWFTPGKIVSNGPFRMESWRVNRKMRLRKSPTYWGASEVTLDSIDSLPVENTTTALNLYLTGEADWLPGSYPPDLVDRLRQRPDYHHTPGLGVYYYKFNTTKKPFDDPRVRRAIGLGFDRRLVTDELLRRGEIPANTIVPPVPGYVSAPSLYAHVPTAGETPEAYEKAFREGLEVAKRLLAEAGYPGGRGFPRSAIVFNTLDAHRKIAEFIADQLRRNLGIDVNAVNQEWQSYLDNVQRLNYDIARAGWIGDYRDPNTFLDLWITKGGNNQTGFGDPFYDRLIQLGSDPLSLAAMPADARAALFAKMKERDEAESLYGAMEKASDPKERLEKALALRLHLFHEAETILFTEAFPVMPIYFYVMSGLVSPRVEGIRYTVRGADGKPESNGQDEHPLRNVRVQDR